MDDPDDNVSRIAFCLPMDSILWTEQRSALGKMQSVGSLILFALDSDSTVPIYRQLYGQLRKAIVSGQISPGSRLPASRSLADDLNVSRNTVVAAIDMLRTEGYLVGRLGAGTYVASSLPEDRFLPREPSDSLSSSIEATPPDLSARGRLLAQLSLATGAIRPIPFVADLPAFDAFPIDAWAKLMVQSWREVQPSMLGYADPAGYGPLRELIAEHLRASRMVRASASEVIVTSGSQQSLDLLARLLIDPGDSVWLEEPGYLGARSAFVGSGAKVVPVPVDASGLNIEQGVRLQPDPKLIFVSPSRQYPLGMTMGLERRRDLLEFAAHKGAWVIEDDYDSEFRYVGSPLPAIQSMDRSDRVIYLGTFSKSLLPSFRLGYMVVPKTLAPAFVNAKSVIDRHPPLLEQMALTAFIKSGQFAAHVRRMRKLYEERQHILIEEIRTKIGDNLRVAPAETGMHLIADLPDHIDDQAFCRAALKRGISIRPLSMYYAGSERKMGLILGFAAIPPARIRWGVDRLAVLLRGA